MTSARTGRDTAAALWTADILGPRFQQRTLAFAADDEGDVADYFLHAERAEFLTDAGFTLLRR
jgi:hypothetical protein